MNDLPSKMNQSESRRLQKRRFRKPEALQNNSKTFERQSNNTATTGTRFRDPFRRSWTRLSVQNLLQLLHEAELDRSDFEFDSKSFKLRLKQDKMAGPKRETTSQLRPSTGASIFDCKYRQICDALFDNHRIL